MAFVAAQGMRCVALTDHDTVAGIAEAVPAAQDLGLSFVPGIELSSQWLGRGIHILGLNIDVDCEALKHAIEVRAQMRATRFAQILTRLARAGVVFNDPTRWQALAVPTRTHLAAALVAEGHCASVNVAFKQYLGERGVAYVPTHWPDLASSIASIRAAGGMAVLAHPLRYTCSAGQRRQLLKEFITHGGVGMEAVCGGMGVKALEQAQSLALRFGLKVTRGSDCHNPQLPWQQPARLAKLHPSLTPLWAQLDANRALA